ncbi:MAG: CinA family protein [Cohaesibacter sp.]|jgi:nicotinamide-nucleotide amidase|nr:CinA family protein [Cohaesibacter sp.]
MHLTDKTLTLAQDVIEKASAKGIMIATAESCTAGLIAATLTEIAGSSAVIDRGFVTYSNEAKMDILGVPQEMLDAHGAVSEPVAKAMAQGALAHSRAQLTISVTGIAGPGGGSAEKPVGLVHFGAACKDRTLHDAQIFKGPGRQDIRAATVEHALIMLLEEIERL